MTAFQTPVTDRAAAAMSTERSSSAVRNLRSIFETKNHLDNSSSPDSRGRSTSGLGSQENSRPTSKVRASFITVDKPGEMASAVMGEEGGLGHVLPGLKRESSAGLRRGSFTENDENGEALLQLKKTVSQEADRRERDSKVPEAIPEHAATSNAATPLLKPDTEQKDEAVEESPLAHKVDKEPANPDKPATAAEEDPAELQPAEPTNEAAVSGGEALPPVAEDLRPKSEETPAPASDASASAELGAAVEKAKQQPAKPTPNGKPAPISTKTASQHKQPLRSPASQAKSPLSDKAQQPVASRREPAKKAFRSSLTAPTAASVARAASGSSKPSPPSKPAAKREPTKPIDISRLTAPTAASKAREGAAPAPSTNGRASTTTRPKPAVSARPTPRSSLQRPDSRASQASKKPAHAPADGSFLERMMRPTAASAGKAKDAAKSIVGKPDKTKGEGAGAPKAAKKESLANGTSHTDGPGDEATHAGAPAEEVALPA